MNNPSWLITLIIAILMTHGASTRAPFPSHICTHTHTHTRSPRPLENSIWPESNGSSGRRNESSVGLSIPGTGIERVIFDPAKLLLSREEPLPSPRVTFLLPSPPPCLRGGDRAADRFESVMLRGKRQKAGGNRRKHASACLVSR